LGGVLYLHHWHPMYVLDSYVSRIFIVIFIIIMVKTHFNVYILYKNRKTSH